MRSAKPSRGSERRKRSTVILLGLRLLVNTQIKTFDIIFPFGLLEREYLAGFGFAARAIARASYFHEVGRIQFLLCVLQSTLRGTLKHVFIYIIPLIFEHSDRRR